MTDKLPCFACGKSLNNFDPDGGYHPFGGLEFNTSGHYGSTVFDPMDGSKLLITVCDQCLVDAAKLGRVTMAKPRPQPRRPKDKLSPFKVD